MVCVENVSSLGFHTSLCWVKLSLPSHSSFLSFSPTFNWLEKGHHQSIAFSHKNETFVLESLFVSTFLPYILTFIFMFFFYFLFFVDFLREVILLNYDFCNKVQRAIYDEWPDGSRDNALGEIGRKVEHVCNVVSSQPSQT